MCFQMPNGPDYASFLVQTRKNTSFTRWLFPWRSNNALPLNFVCFLILVPMKHKIWIEITITQCCFIQRLLLTRYQFCGKAIRADINLAAMSIARWKTGGEIFRIFWYKFARFLTWKHTEMKQSSGNYPCCLSCKPWQICHLTFEPIDTNEATF